MNTQLALCSNKIVTPNEIRNGAILITEGKIVDVVSTNEIPSHFIIENIGELVASPGLVDSHVHINEPGRTDWEGFETATKSAAVGGITTLVDMPLNSSPVTTTREALQKKVEAAKGKIFVDCGFYAGVIPGNTNELQPLIDAGVLGVKAFLVHSGIDDFPNVTEQDLRRGILIIAKNNVPLLVHCELQQETENRKAETLSSSVSYQNYLYSHPRKWENDAIALMIQLSDEYKCKTHIVHLSSSDAIEMLSGAKRRTSLLTVETCPHYVYFSAEEIPDGATQYKCAPPIREKENKEQLWNALRNGIIDFIVSDHSPCPPEMKLLGEGHFIKAWGGIASLQLGLSIVWSEAQRRNFSLTHISQWMSERPAEFIGLGKSKGKIAKGYDADIVIWNPEKSFVVKKENIFHKHKLTPYEGRTLQGCVEKTFLRGQKVFEDGNIVSEPVGRIILRH